MGTLPQDLLGGLRRLRAQPGFSLVAILCLALGIGANTAVFSVLNVVVLQPLPFPVPRDLTLIWSQYPTATGEAGDYYTTTNNFVEIEHASSFQSIGSVLDLDFDLAGTGGDPERVRGGEASVGIFDVTSTRAIAGRLFDVSDGASGGTPVVVIDEGLWERRFGRDSSAVGASLEVNGVLRTVIGVVAENTAYPLEAELWFPLVPDEMTAERRQRGMLTVIARLRDGASRDGSQAEMDGLAVTLQRLLPQQNRGLGFRVMPLQEALTESTRPTVLLLGLGVLLVLGIACANVANLLLVRLQRERLKVALQSALGASRRRLIRQQLTENIALAALGGVVGVGLAFAVLPSLLALAPEGTVGLDRVAIDAPVLAFALVVSMCTVAVFGVAPAVVGSRADPADLLRSGGRGASGSKLSARLQSVFVVTQVGVGVLLLVGAGLTAKSLGKLLAVDPGFVTDGAVSFRLSASPVRYPAHGERVAFFRSVMESMLTLPGVTSTGAAHVLPIGDVAWGLSHSVQDLPPSDPEAQEMAFMRVITPGYLESMGIALLEGRDFERRDALDTDPVVIVSRALAHRYWPDGNAVGRRIKERGYYSDHPWITVVGVVTDVRDDGLASDPSPTIYLPMAQRDLSYLGVMSIVVRVDARPTDVVQAIREEVRRLDSAAPVFRVRTLDDVVHGSLGGERFSTVLLTIFAALGLALAAAGVYGVMAQIADQRQREMAIRTAFGAPAMSLAFLMIRRAAVLAGVGTLMGLVVASASTRFLSGILFEVDTLDPVTLGLVSTYMIVAAILACVVPALRVARVDPGVMLSSE